MDRRHLALGLIFTWVVGMGRWWEDPHANLLQQLGVGSLVYVFALTLFLWLLLWPMAPPRWSFYNLLTFITLTSPPGILYAIPVRHGLELEGAQTVRMLFLGIVAGWRVLLLAFYLHRGAGLERFPRLVATFFPLTMIVTALAVLNLERVVFEFMGGRGTDQATVNDDAFGVLVLITLGSIILFIPLFLAYAVISVPALMRKFRRNPAIRLES